MLFFAPEPEFEGRACADLTEEQREFFFSENGNGYKRALSICGACPLRVRERCLESALDFEYGLDKKYRFGVWGGETVAGRIRIEKARRSA